MFHTIWMWWEAVADDEMVTVGIVAIAAAIFGADYGNDIVHDAVEAVEDVAGDLFDGDEAD